MPVERVEQSATADEIAERVAALEAAGCVVQSVVEVCDEWWVVHQEPAKRPAATKGRQTR